MANATRLIEVKLRFEPSNAGVASGILSTIKSKDLQLVSIPLLTSPEDIISMDPAAVYDYVHRLGWGMLDTALVNHHTRRNKNLQVEFVWDVDKTKELWNQVTKENIACFLEMLLERSMAAGAIKVVMGEKPCAPTSGTMWCTA